MDSYAKFEAELCFLNFLNDRHDRHLGTSLSDFRKLEVQTRDRVDAFRFFPMYLQ